MSYTEHLTGRVRFRQQNLLFRQPVVVLQVEVTEKDESEVRFSPACERTFWRDAKVSDITTNPFKEPK